MIIYLWGVFKNLSVRSTTCMMFIIVESGSTKADWVAVESPDITRFYSTAGINPSTQHIFPALSETPGLAEEILKAEVIFFYSAGLVDDASRTRMDDWVRSTGFKGQINSEDDMIAAARACCGSEPGIVGILGTGSNSCLYDGQSITTSIPSLGYIISDEGGGVHLGKEILKSYFYMLMPSADRTLFESQFPVSRATVLERLYRTPGANTYLASFARFLQMTDSEWKTGILKKVFREFIQLRLLPYPECSKYHVSFTGSIAYYHRHILSETLDEFGLHTGKIIQKPISKLIEYHINNS